MPKATRIPSGFSFTHKFQELPLHWQFEGGIAWRGCLIDGEFEVSADGPDDWWISDVRVAVDNGKLGAEAKGKLITLDADTDERFYLLALDAIDHAYAHFIQEMIDDEAAAFGLRLVA